MAQVRMAAVLAAATLVVSTLAISGCSLRDSGSGVKNTQGYEDVEIAGSAHSNKYMSLLASAMDVISGVIPLPFTLQGESTEAVEDAEISDVAPERVEQSQKYTMN
jgi:hypothetical protein